MKRVLTQDAFYKKRRFLNAEKHIEMVQNKIAGRGKGKKQRVQPLYLMQSNVSKH